MKRMTPDMVMPQRDYQITRTIATQQWSYPTHRHSAFGDLMYVVSGRLIQTINGQRSVASDGTLIWIREDDWHELSGRRLEFFNLNFNPARFEAVAAAMGTQSTYQHLVSMEFSPVAYVPKPRRPAMVELLTELWEGQDGPRRKLMLGKTLAVLYADWFAPLAEEFTPQRMLPAWLRSGMDYIYTHIEQGVTVEQLIDICQRSPEHISRSFQHYLECTPSQYMNRQRLERAAVWLAKTDRDILDICYSLGFNSPSYFYRLFRQRYGCPPRQYRDKTR